MIKLKHFLFLLVIACFSCNSPKNNPEVKNIKQSYVFSTPVTKNCHAATLVEVTPNKLMAAWFGGSYEGAKDVGIYTASFDGKSWTRPNNIIKPLITEKDTLPCWNPVLFKSKSKHLYLFYKIGKNPREWFGAVINSSDNGQSWSTPKYLPKGFLGPIRNKPIETSTGVILCGSSTESIETNKWRVHLEEYTETTNEWRKINIEDKNNFEIIQPTFLVHSKHTIQMLCRSKHNKIITSWSEDNGKHWIKTDSINVINSNSGIDALAVSKNAFLLVNNPLKQGPDWFYGRNILDVEFSTDGLNWKTLFNLEKKVKGEFSYPAIIQTSDKKIHILYTYNREFIKHTSFNLEL
jgi:predicted neuraminidase